MHNIFYPYGARLPIQTMPTDGGPVALSDTFSVLSVRKTVWFTYQLKMNGRHPLTSVAMLKRTTTARLYLATEFIGCLRKTPRPPLIEKCRPVTIYEPSSEGTLWRLLRTLRELSKPCSMCRRKTTRSCLNRRRLVGNQ